MRTGIVSSVQLVQPASVELRNELPGLENLALPNLRTRKPMWQTLVLWCWGFVTQRALLLSIPAAKGTAIPGLLHLHDFKT